MSSVVGEHGRVVQAFAEPTLSLLQGRLSPATVAVFRAAFPREVKTQPVARLHQLVDAMLQELRARGITEVPEGDGRDVCMRWVRRKWLTRDLDGATYSLTSYAMQALALVQSLTRDRVNLSEHRIKNIIDTAHRINTASNPDRDERVRILREQIAQQQAELDHLEAGGELKQVSADYIVEGLTELQDLVSGLPVEFARFQELVGEMQEKLRADFRSDDRSPGEIVADYLQRADSLTTSTPEGRAFEGAFNLLDDDALIDRLRSDIIALVEHPELADLLTAEEKKALLGIVRMVSDGARATMQTIVDTVETLNTYIRARNVIEDRELDSVLWELDSTLGQWMLTAGARATVPVEMLPEVLDIEWLAEKFYDPTRDIPLVPLQEAAADRPSGVSFEELRRYGGPHLEDLRGALDDAASADAAGWTVGGNVFPRLPAEIRRPVDVLGILHLATERADLTRVNGVERYVTRRPDGSEQILVVPIVAPKTGSGVLHD